MGADGDGEASCIVGRVAARTTILRLRSVLETELFGVLSPRCLGLSYLWAASASANRRVQSCLFLVSRCSGLVSAMRSDSPTAVPVALHDAVYMSKTPRPQ